MRILIIDDELYACKSLQAIIEKTEYSITSIEFAHSIENAKTTILNNHIDIIFLDIKLGKKTGFDILESEIIDKNTVVIISTAFENYALKSYKYEITNYILKPFEIEEVRESLFRAYKKLRAQRSLPKSFENLYFVSNHNGGVMIRKEDIIYIESKGAYSEIHLSNSPSILISKNLKKIEIELKFQAIFRINRFNLVNVNHILSYDNKSYILYLSENKQIQLSNVSALFDFLNFR